LTPGSVPPTGGKDPTRGRVSTALATLKDVAGIAGSFVFTTNGQLVAREIHAMFDDAALNEAAERLTRLCETFASVGDQVDLAVIRFQDHKLYLKALNGGMLCILADGVVNMAALRMAANLVGRRVAADIERLSAGPDAPSEMEPTEGDGEALSGVVAPPAGGRDGVVRAPVFAPGTRRFRGRSVQ
jgi:predicted regulator of Ras-like GTPase activity (Roadblock/LC7/MglB family)